ncbi:hypothetical protein SUGI_0996020 [Cryptomeria japonica]|uniref:uncharacterized protein LOC131060656 n=1 Tax=Cryptomeria japonica TaxID=3369 RepID=UPI0024148942|nr:uncharacterized protein LOC131060656 [Cryptomeria japonica]GLJ47183.1 hypothetical protein SUGI_0996020 [Cryptomeria japonica]
MPWEPAAQGSPASNDMNAKHSSLMEDYLQLQDEFAALKDRLQAAKMTKATLNAEVRFLRLRLEKLKRSPSDLGEKEINSVIMPFNSLTAYRSKAVSGAVMPEPSSHSPMNNSPGTTEIPVFRELLRTNGSEELIKRNPVNEHSGLVSAPKISALRNTTNVFSITMAGKRKVSWQDEISLKCN